MEKHQGVFTEKGHKPAGPYSQATILGNLVFVSGQGAVDPATQQLVRGTVEEETERTLKNLQIILESAGSSLEKVVKVNTFLSDMDNYQRFNAVFGKFFKEPYPARSVIQAARLPFDIQVEIECIAYR